jgi:hypothetical protein
MQIAHTTACTIGGVLPVFTLLHNRLAALGAIYTPSTINVCCTGFE